MAFEFFFLLEMQGWEGVGTALVCSASARPAPLCCARHGLAEPWGSRGRGEERDSQLCGSISRS